MKAEIGPAKIEITKEDYDALQALSRVGIFQIISDQFDYWRQLNLLRISDKFKRKCEEKGVDPRQVSPKFLVQFMEASSLDEDEEIQEIWSDILMKEAQEPGSVSLRTISSLKALSPDEAKTFRSLYSNILKYNNSLAVYNDRREEKSPIDDIIKLVDCGLLVSENTNITVNIAIKPKSKDLVSLSATDKYAIIAQNKEDVEQRCVVPIFSLTQAGQDIIKATFEANDEEKHFRSIAKKIQEGNSSLMIGLFEVEQYKDTGQFTYSPNNLLEE